MDQKVKEALDLIESFAEARHKQGLSTYNASTQAAFQAVIDCLVANFAKPTAGGMSNNGLTKLMEECGELVQIAAKKVAYPDVEVHPDGQNLNSRLQEEMGDVLAAITFTTAKLGLSMEDVLARAHQKKALYAEWDKGN